MAGEHRVDIADYTRVRYFDGLFLKEAEFTLDQHFHIAARRYLNYLLFKPGRLYTDDAVPPLQVTAAGASITVSPGTALIRDDAQRVAYEVHLANSVTLDLSTAVFGFSAGDTVRVTLEFAEAQRESGTGAAGGAGVLVPGNDRWVEQAVIRLSAPGDPPSGNPSVVLADVDFTVPMSNGNVTNTGGRGGVRLEILSDDIRALLSAGPGLAILSFTPTSGPVGTAVTITGTGFAAGATIAFGGTPATVVSVDSSTQITATVPAGATTGPIAVTVSGNTATSVASFSVGAAGPTISSFTPTSGPVGSTITINGTGFAIGATVTFTGAAPVAATFVSSTQITAVVPAGATTGLIAVTVGGITSIGSNFTVTVGVKIVGTNVSAQSSNATVVIRGTNIRNPSISPALQAAGTTIRLNAAGVVPTLVDAVASTIIALADASSLQRVQFTMPARPAAWPVNQPVTLRLEFGSGFDEIPFAYDD
jgi:hypothetical protein